MQKEELLSEINSSTSQLIETLLKVNEEDFNKKNSPESWSVADVAEHLLILETNVNFAMQKTHATERPANLKIEAMKLGLADMERKFMAPDFVKPTWQLKQKNVLITELKKQRDILNQIILTKELAETSDFKHPVIGSMTILEWVHFNIFHTQRHIKQIKTILLQ